MPPFLSSTLWLVALAQSATIGQLDAVLTAPVAYSAHWHLTAN